MIKMNSTWNRRGIGPLLLAVLVLWGLAATAAPTWNGSIEAQDGWDVVLNPAEPMQEQEIIEAEPLWRIGGDEEDVLFGLIEDAIVDDDGNTYLLDTVLSQVYVVDKEGEIDRTLSREGDGPGEFRFARELVFLPSGDLGVMEMMPGKIVSFDRQGTPRPSFAMSSSDNAVMNHLQHIAATDDLVLVGKVVTNFGNGTASTRYSLTSYDAKGDELAVLMEHKEEQSGGNISLDIGGDSDFTSNFTLCDDGRVVLYRNAKDYKLEIFDRTGAKLHAIRREYESVRRSEEELEASRRQAEDMRERFNGSVEMEIEEWARDISNVIARPNGELWVANSQGDRDCPETAIGFFDAFDRDGRYARRVAIRADYDPARDNFAIDGDRLYVFKEAQKAPPRSSTMGGGGGGMVMMMVSGGTPDDEEDEDEEVRPFEVICYRLPR